MPDLTGSSMHRLVGPADAAAQRGCNCLVAQANTQQGQLAMQLALAAVSPD